MEQTKWYPISLNREVNNEIVNRQVARQLIRVHGDKAHLVALSHMLGNDEQHPFHPHWRRVLDIVDEINKGEIK